MIKIKICGCRSKEDIAIVNRYRPDYMGFVFAPSKRMIEDAKARELKEMLSKEVKAVGVFVNESIQRIVSLCKDEVIDFVQLHGDETKEYIYELRKFVKQPIIRAVRVKSKEQILQENKVPCDFLLLDTFHKDIYGGSGLSFDWGVIPEEIKPYFLAGGLDINNIERAYKECKAYCFDISSGVETNGVKDELKVKNIIERLRSFNGDKNY